MDRTAVGDDVATGRDGFAAAKGVAAADNDVAAAGDDVAAAGNNAAAPCIDNAATGDNAAVVEGEGAAAGVGVCSVADVVASDGGVFGFSRGETGSTGIEGTPVGGEIVSDGENAAAVVTAT